MRFLNPTGLWILLGIPILIIIYIIRSKHEERPVSSTYIWKLSNRFMKKRLPLQKLRRVLLFAMQLLFIVAGAMIVSRPAIVNGESKTYIAIVDASASMQTEDETGTSRFAYALEEVKELAKKIQKGHTVSVVLSSDKASYVVQKSSSVNEVRHAIKKMSCSQGDCDIEEALELVQLECERNPNVEVLFYTDCDYKETEGLRVINLNKKEWNVSLEKMTSESDGSNTVFKGQLTSYNQDADVAVGLKINGKISDAQQVHCEKDVATEITFTAENLLTYETAEIYIEETDGLSLDNMFAVCKEREKTYDVLLVSRSPLYLESVLKSLGNCEVSVVKDISIAELSNFDLYVFDGIAPEEYPTDGAVLIFGTELLPEGLQAGNIVDTAEEISIASDVQSELYDGLKFTDTVAIDYAPLTGSKEWEPLLFCGEDVVLMTKKNESGLRTSLVSFDVHDSNLPMQEEFGVFMRNMVAFSIPSLIKKLDYEVGETVQVTVLPETEELSVTLPDGLVKKLSTAKEYAGLIPEEIGVYHVAMTKVGRGEEADFFVHIPEGEMDQTVDASLKLEKMQQGEEKQEDAVSELWFIVAAVMLLLLLIEWGWYYHEQY